MICDWKGVANDLLQNTHFARYFTRGNSPLRGLRLAPSTNIYVRIISVLLLVTQETELCL